MKIQILTKRFYFFVVLTLMGLLQANVVSQVPIRPLNQQESAKKSLPPIIAAEFQTKLPAIKKWDSSQKPTTTLPKVKPWKSPDKKIGSLPAVKPWSSSPKPIGSLPSVKPWSSAKKPGGSHPVVKPWSTSPKPTDKLPVGKLPVEKLPVEKLPTIKQWDSSRKSAENLPPVKPTIESSSKLVQPIAPVVSNRKRETSVIVAKRKELVTLQKEVKKDVSSTRLPSVKPWDGKTTNDFKIPKKISPSVEVKKDIRITPATFANPEKPLPKIVRAGKDNEIDTTNQMFITLPKSSLKKVEPILITRNPAGFKENEVSSSRKSAPIQSWTPENKGYAQVPVTAALPPATSLKPVELEKKKDLSWNANSVRSKQKMEYPAKPALSKQELKSQIEALMPKRKNNSDGAKSGRFVSNPYMRKSAETLSESAAARWATNKVKPVAEPKPIMPQVPMATSQDSEPIVESIGGTVYPRSPVAVLRGEALFVTRERGRAFFSDNFLADPFEYKMGFRLNAQRLFGVGGRGLTYTGVQDWNSVTRVGSAGGLGILSTPGVGLPAGVLTPFTGASFQQQHHRANYHSLEWNNVTWGWDVLNLFWGVRVTHYEEEFNFFSARADGQQGLLDVDIENFVIGPQIGGEVYYDIGSIFSTGMKVKLGAMATGVEHETQLFSNGVRRINNENTDVKFNFLAEVGVFTRMRLGPRAYLRGGYELWYNSTMYGVDENIPSAITPAFGQTSFDDDLFIHGATLGLEILW